MLALGSPRWQAFRHTDGRRVAGGGVPTGWHMSISTTETILRAAKLQISQRDINESLLKAIGELTGEVKRLDDEIRRVRRDVQVARRF